MSRLTDIKSVLTKQRQPAFRLNEILKAVYTTSCTSYQDLPYLPTQLKNSLSETIGPIINLTVISRQRGEQADKVLFHTKDNRPVEAVLLSYKGGHNALCISSQSGCALGCLFCATGTLGLLKNLTSDEITDQILFFKKEGISIDSIILMGMGEPFSNMENVFAALADITNPLLFGMSPRRISVSTVGIIPGIKRLITEFPQINLAYSLHSPFFEQRLKLMPITKGYPPEDVFPVLDEYITKTNHKVFIAYLLLDHFNDSSDHAEALSKLINARPRPDLYHVNLIRYNPANNQDIFKRSSNSRIEAFQHILTRQGIHQTLRQDFGTDIDAACGQLAGKSL